MVVQAVQQDYSKGNTLHENLRLLNFVYSFKSLVVSGPVQTPLSTCVCL